MRRRTVQSKVRSFVSVLQSPVTPFDRSKTKKGNCSESATFGNGRCEWTQPHSRGEKLRCNFLAGKSAQSSPILRCKFLARKVQNSSSISALLKWRHVRLTLSLSLSLSLCISLSPSAPHAQYRKRFRASYNTPSKWTPTGTHTHTPNKVCSPKTAFRKCATALLCRHQHFSSATVLSGAEERGVDGPSLDRSYFSRLQPISFLFFNPASSHGWLACSAHTVGDDTCRAGNAVEMFPTVEVESFRSQQCRRRSFKSSSQQTLFWCGETFLNAWGRSFFKMKFQPGRSLANRSSAPDSTVRSCLKKKTAFKVFSHNGLTGWIGVKIVLRPATCDRIFGDNFAWN